jgi:hypothetical protein
MIIISFDWIRAIIGEHFNFGEPAYAGREGSRIQIVGLP